VARAHTSVANSLSARATPYCSWGSLVSRHRPVPIVPSMHACTLRRPRPPLSGHGRPVRVVRMLTAHSGSTLLTHHVASNVGAPLFSPLPFSSFTRKPPPPHLLVQPHHCHACAVLPIPAEHHPRPCSPPLSRALTFPFFPSSSCRTSPPLPPATGLRRCLGTSSSYHLHPTLTVDPTLW
jgi:hypothetical protein